jgi:uncharacterized protein
MKFKMSDNTLVDSFYEQALQGNLVGLECESKHVIVPPTHSCSICGSQSLRKIQLSGRGEIVSFTEVFVKSREFPVDVPYVLALVQLEEGGKLIGVAETGSGFNLTHGSKIKVEFRKMKDDAWPRIFFRLV